MNILSFKNPIIIKIQVIALLAILLINLTACQLNQLPKVDMTDPIQIVKMYSDVKRQFQTFNLAPADYIRFYNQIHLHDFENQTVVGYVDFRNDTSEALKGSDIKGMSSQQYKKAYLSVHPSDDDTQVLAELNAALEVYYSDLMTTPDKQALVYVIEVRTDTRQNTQDHILKTATLYSYYFTKNDNGYLISERRALFSHVIEDSSIDLAALSQYFAQIRLIDENVAFNHYKTFERIE